MANAILGQSAPSATTYTALYTVPASNFLVANVSIANRASTAVTVRLAVAAATTPTNAEFIEFDTTIPGFGVLERTGIAVPAGRIIVVYASNANTSCSTYGILQPSS